MLFCGCGNKVNILDVTNGKVTESLEQASKLLSLPVVAASIFQGQLFNLPKQKEKLIMNL